MSPAKKSLLPPRTLLAVLQPLVVMLREQRMSIAEVVAGGVSARDSAVREKLSHELGLSEAHVEALLTLLDGLYQRLEELGADSGELEGIIAEYIERLAEKDEGWKDQIQQKTVLSSTVAELLSSSLELARVIRKVERLQKGFLRNAKTFSTLVDLRPNYSETSDEIESWLQVVQFRITTDAAAAIDREITFQCDRKALTELRDCLDKVEKKLLVMSRQSPISKVGK